MPAGDNPHSISEKKAALRESPKQPKSVVNEQHKTSPFPKDNAAEVVGIKRQQPNGPLSPTNYHMLGNSGANGHLVYVRRRLETDQNKGGTSASAGNVNSISVNKTVAGGSQSKEQSLKHQNSVPHTQSAPCFAPPAAVTASPAFPSAGLPAHHSFGKQSPGKVGVEPTNDVITSLPPRNVVSASSTSVLQSSAAGNLAPSNVSPTSTASRGPISVGLPAHHSFGKQSPGNVAVQPTNNVITSLPPRTTVLSTPVLQSSAAANVVPRTTASRGAISATTLAPNRAGPLRSSNQDWSDRFIRLQAFLRNNEQSGQEEYIRMLRSLSPVGRTKHAMELEKRAANLLVEEGKELQKMKVLNVLGRLLPSDPLSFPSQPSSVAHLPFPARR